MNCLTEINKLEEKLEDILQDISLGQSYAIAVYDLDELLDYATNLKIANSGNAYFEENIEILITKIKNNLKELSEFTNIPVEINEV